MPCCWSPGGGLLLGGGVSALGDGLLLWPSVVVFCYALVMAFWFGGHLIEGGLLVWSSGGTRRP